MYLIDGYNLLHQTDLEHREDLISELDKFLVFRKKQGIIVFDGFCPEDLSTQSLDVKFTGDADEGIIDILKAVENPNQYVLISSDKELLQVARDKKVKYTKSEDFNFQVLKKQLVSLDEDPSLEFSDQEAKEWLNEILSK